MSNKSSRPPTKVPPQQGRQVVAVSHGQVWQGPLPPPEELVAFNQAVPGLAETIVEMAKQEAEHRRHLEEMSKNEAIDIRKGDHAARTRGQCLACIVVVVFTAGGVACAYLHAPWASALFAASGLSSIVRLFLTSADTLAKSGNGK